jgi:hypothetical protein
MAAGGEMTLAEMRTDVREALKNRTDVTDARLTHWLKWGYKHVSHPNIYRHRELQGSQNITLATSTYSYAVNDDLFGLYTVRNSTIGFKMWPRDYRWMQELTRHSGRPAFYCLWNRNMVVFPTPDSTHNGNILDVAYWQRPPALVDSTAAASALAPEWDECIVLAAVWRAWRALDQPDRALEARENFAGMVNEIGSTMQVDGEDSGFQIEVLNTDSYMDRG